MEVDMKRPLLVLPLACAMMTSPLAFAQTPPTEQAPVQGAPAQQGQAQNQGAPAQQGQAQKKSADCVDLTEGAAPAGTAQEMTSALKAPPDGDNKPNSGKVAAAPGASASETHPVVGPDAGTAPGGSGSSGWTGGLGGSDIGTSQTKELNSSPQQEHPAVATGLDPISGKTAVEGPQAPAAQQKAGPEKAGPARAHC